MAIIQYTLVRDDPSQNHLNLKDHFHYQNEDQSSFVFGALGQKRSLWGHLIYHLTLCGT